MTTIDVYGGDGILTGPVEGRVVRQSVRPLVNLVKKPLYPQQTPGGHTVKFPFPMVRPGQMEVVDEAMTVLNRDSDVLLCASTGFGKSPAAIAIASLHENSWLLVGRNDLVEQWRSDYEGFQDVGFLKSRDQFACAALAHTPDGNGKPYTCNTGKALCRTVRKQITAICQLEGEVLRDTSRLTAPEVLLRDPRFKNQLGTTVKGMGDTRLIKDAAHAWQDQTPCPYMENRDFALSQKHTIMTVAMALTIFTYLRDFPNVQTRALLVVDECSELESELIRFFEVIIRSSWVSKLFGPRAKLSSILPDTDPLMLKLAASAKNIDEDGNVTTTIGDFLRQCQPKDLTEAMEWLTIMERIALIKKNRLTDDAQDEIDEIDDFLSKVEHAREGIALDVPYHFTCDVDEGSYKVRISPLEARGLYDHILAPMADRAVFMSATTGTAELFRATHAMKRNLKYIEGGSPFPAGNRPIFFTPKGNLTRKYFDQDIQGVCDAVVQIAQTSQSGHYDHVNQKGLVHTFTNRVTEKVVEAFSRAGQRKRIMILSGSGRQRVDIIQAFKASSDPLVLVSPSAQLGLSLDDDMGRWQVVVKMPYANLGEPSVAHRKEKILGWYGWQTSKDLIQSFGRIVRSPTDWGLTYLLDQSFESHMRFNRSHFPAYILSALHGV